MAKKIKIIKPGEGSLFTELTYRGMPIVSDEKFTTGIAYFQHIYLSSFMRPYKKKRHACLQNGWWCWQNLREHPRDLLSYLKGFLVLKN